MSMEEVKLLNAQFNEKGMFFGETSRSDMFEEEKHTGGALKRAKPSKRDHGRDENTFPQPYLARNHTLKNVCCTSSSHLFRNNQLLLV